MDWREIETSEFDDGKYNSKKNFSPFPGYLVSKEHPFTVCQFRINNDEHWCTTDNQSNLIESLKIMPSDWKYRTKQIVYKVNSSGYRTHEWKDIDWKNAIVMMGCSNTFGIGLADDEIAAVLLAEKTGRQIVNLGFPSSSIDLVLSNSVSLIENFGYPYSVIINWPDLARMRYYWNHGYTDLGAWTEPNTIENNVNLFDLWHNMYYSETNLLVRGFHISKAVKALFLNRTKYITYSNVEMSAHYTRADAYFPSDHSARDLRHPGYDVNLKVTEFLYGRLQNE
jgi:hypothetical protein